jgi:hypothetical protein
MRSLLLSFTVLLSSCAATNSVPPDFRFGPQSAQALVVGSITYDSGLGAYGVSATSRDGSSVFGASVGFSQWPPLGPEFDEALKKKGGTFAVAVTPGQYTLQRWGIRRGSMVSAAAQPIGLVFKADAGRVTYLGNFHFDKNGDVTLSDQAGRDLPVLQARHPAAALAATAYAIPSGARLERIGNTTTPRVDDRFYAPTPSPSR